MNESGQEQAIAQIREELKVEFSDYDDLKESAECLLEIVDSQAQKIADLNRVGSNTLLALIESQEKIAEQANEIERLKAANDMAEKARINSSLNEYYRKSL